MTWQRTEAAELGFSLITPANVSGQVMTFAVHVTEWKRAFVQQYFPGRCFRFLPKNLSERDFEHVWKPTILARDTSEIFVWGPELPPALAALATARSIPVWFMEDGFLRSARPSASRTAPLSLTLDRRTPYFDCRQPSDLEVLLMTYDFVADQSLVARARAGTKLLLESGISKYNNGRIRTTEEVLADDRQPNTRRGRGLSLEALFAGAYLLYPRYVDPETGEQTSFEATVAATRRQIEEPEATSPGGPGWRAWGLYGILGWRHLLTAALVPGHPARWQ